MRKIVGSKPLCAGVLLALFVFVLAMAQSGALHRLVHADASKPNHQCAATMLASGQVDSAPVGVSISPPTVLTFLCALPEVPLLLAVDYSLLPSRGPPALLT